MPPLAEALLLEAEHVSSQAIHSRMAGHRWVFSSRARVQCTVQATGNFGMWAYVAVKACRQGVKSTSTEARTGKSSTRA